jgi:hypothetical protein
MLTEDMGSKHSLPYMETKMIPGAATEFDGILKLIFSISVKVRGVPAKANTRQPDGSKEHMCMMFFPKWC